MSSANHSRHGLGSTEEGKAGVQEPEGVEDSEKTDSLNQQDECTYTLSDPEAAGTGSHRSAPRPLYIYYKFQFSVFMEFLRV